jgi:hypothetical protein
MAPKPLNDDIYQKALDSFTIHNNKAAAARELCLPIATYKHRLDEAKRRGFTPSSGVIAQAHATEDDLRAQIKVLQTQLDAKQIHITQAPAIVKPRYSVRVDGGSKEKIRICAIGDAHDSPHIPNKERFEWIGAHIRKTKPDVVLQIGDFATLDSLNAHDGNETWKGKFKPTFKEDVESLSEALGAMNVSGPELHMTEGNHERRASIFENNHPETHGTMHAKLIDIFRAHGWGVSPYGFIQKYGGVGFVHAALNAMGKTYGGKNAENTIANDSQFDVVIGHSHRSRVVRMPKIGENNHVTVLNLGCALPDGFIENYAKHSTTGWSYGIYDLLIQHGHIEGYNNIPMSALNG